MIKGFKDFLLRGNVIDLAVALVIGAASPRDQVVHRRLHPADHQLDRVAGSPASASSCGRRPPESSTSAASSRDHHFVIVAAVIYFVIVVPVNNLSERRKSGEEPEVAAPTEDILLLQEIRDLLRQRSL